MCMIIRTSSQRMARDGRSSVRVSKCLGPELTPETLWDWWMGLVQASRPRRLRLRVASASALCLKFALLSRKDTAVALDGLEHNFYFTLELHTTFVYKSQGPAKL